MSPSASNPMLTKLSTTTQLMLIPSQAIDNTNININTNHRDNIAIGDMHSHKNDTNIRLWLQNPNGITYTAAAEDINLRIQYMRTMKINVWAVPETHLVWTPLIQEIIQKVGQQNLATSKPLAPPVMKAQ
eukprot:7847065-Ditylum_brightwellii.AAC.1